MVFNYPAELLYLATALIQVRYRSARKLLDDCGDDWGGTDRIASLVGVSPSPPAPSSGPMWVTKSLPFPTTILAAQLAEVNIHTHIRAAIWTSGPAFLVSLVVFAVLGLRESGAADNACDRSGSWIRSLDYSAELDPPGRLLRLLQSAGLTCNHGTGAARRAHGGNMQPQPCCASSVTRRSRLARIHQGLVGAGNWYHSQSGVAELDQLLSRGGMASMLKTLWIIIGAVTFGTMLEEFNLLAKLTTPMLARAKTTGKLIATVVATAIGLNIVAADQYIAIVLPARLFRAEFRKRGLKAQNLSRACADAGTVTSPLVPWNSCGAYMAATLGVPTLLYLPFCIFNIASPLISLLWGFTGFKIEHLQPSEVESEPVTTP
jgi:NhaC family Na+:H+ antiporter